jgi:hypothetical protein
MRLLWSASALGVALSAGVSHTPEKTSEDIVERSLDWPDRGLAWPIGNLRDITVGRRSELEPDGTIVWLARKVNEPAPNHEFL